MTLTGPGGIGKTRIALQLAHDSAGSFRDGRWWVDVDMVPEEALVLPAVVAAVDLRPETAVPFTGLIADHIADRRALLVLDGCERELAEVARLVLVLRDWCPHLHLVVTSRQALGIGGEAVVRVPPLTVPGAGDVPTAASLPQYEAVGLFIDRAVLAGAGFRLTDENAAAVGALTVALDGIPLALELAAARAVALSPADMLDQLTDHLRLLDQGYVDAPDRHRSLVACADWSFDLCSPAQQALWTRMSVFAGGSDLHAVQRVCVGDHLGPDEVPGLVASLVDRSILTATHATDGTVRYGMPTYLAAYGRSRLVEGGARSTGGAARTRTGSPSWRPGSARAGSATGRASCSARPAASTRTCEPRWSSAPLTWRWRSSCWRSPPSSTRSG